MNIKLTQDIPVPKGHGMTAGRVFKVVEVGAKAGRGRVHWWIMGDADIRVGVLRHEAEVTEEEVTHG